jgi:hypothetical protein
MGAAQMEDIAKRLLISDEPAVRYKTLVNVLGQSEGSSDVREAREAVRGSARVERMLSLRSADGRIPGSVYSKFNGAHWVLANLADMGYPPGDSNLEPLRDQTYSLWLSPWHTLDVLCSSESASYRNKCGVPIICGRARRCASQQGNALYSTVALGIADNRSQELAENLMRWQWPDGGWNCDRKAEATNSSFHETLIPMRGLALYAQLSGDDSARNAAERAAEVFLKRRMYRRQSDGSVIHANFLKLHYPSYWHYDVLFGLKVMAEAGFIGDARCNDALDFLESKRLSDGGFPAEAKYYKVSDGPASGGSVVDWGGVSSRGANEFVTVDALFVLKAAGRLK